MYLLTILTGALYIFAFFIYSKKETFDILLCILGAILCFLGAFGAVGGMKTSALSIIVSIVAFACSISYFMIQRKLYKHEEKLSRFRPNKEDKENKEENNEKDEED